MAEVFFIDTSVLVNLLDIPQRNQDHADVESLFLERVSRGATLVLPSASIIETGNFIAQLDDGAVRRERATRLANLLQASVDGRAPWTVAASEWSIDFISALVTGGGTAPSLIELAMQRVGAGDASILREVALYRQRVPSALPVHVWTLDAGLAAYS